MPAIADSMVSLDAPDAGTLARFYAELLGGEVAIESDNFCAVKIGPQLWLSTQRVSDFWPPQWPGGDLPPQLHLDLPVADLDEGESAAVALGVCRRRSAEPGALAGMLDPAGHPFA